MPIDRPCSPVHRRPSRQLRTCRSGWHGTTRRSLACSLLPESWSRSGTGSVIGTPPKRTPDHALGPPNLDFAGCASVRIAKPPLLPKSPGPGCVSPGSGLPVANGVAPSQSGPPSAVAAHAAAYSAVAPASSHLSSLSSRALRRSHPRWEPDCPSFRPVGYDLSGPAEVSGLGLETAARW